MGNSNPSPISCVAGGQKLLLHCPLTFFSAVPALANRTVPRPYRTLNSSRALGIDLDVGRLATQVDAVVAGVLLGYFDESRVWPRRALNSWCTWERRKASALIPSASVS